ncbi:MAG: hypothetical protein JWL86_1957 [Rhizobium sp.]|nr:hypothetical protein [Rhizobium sp.]
MRLLPGSWSKGRTIAAAMISAFVLVVLALVYDHNKATLMDRFLWPKSAHERIEQMASILRRIRSPARWCYASDNPENIYVFKPHDKEGEMGKCLSSIAPVSNFNEKYKNFYIKRFYRAEVGDKFCEVTLSTVFNEDRIVGADCYFGLFPKNKDTGIGMTDDKFG